MKPSDPLGYGWGKLIQKAGAINIFPRADTPAMPINRNKNHAFSHKTVQQSGYKKAVGVRLGYLPLEKMKEPLIYKVTEKVSSAKDWLFQLYKSIIRGKERRDKSAESDSSNRNVFNAIRRAV